MKEKNSNKGFTLIELIVVVAIMAILTGAFAMSFTLVSRQRVANAASSTKQMLQLAQTYSKSKNVCFVKIVGSSDGGANLYIYTRDSASPEGSEEYGDGPAEINRRITTKITYTSVDGSSAVVKTVMPGEEYRIEFDRSTGGFKEVTLPGATTTYYPTQIDFTNGQKTSTLYLATYTGVVTYKNQNK